MHVPVLRQTDACCHGAATSHKRRRGLDDAMNVSPSLEGSETSEARSWVDAKNERRGWGDSLSSARVEGPSPHPVSHFAALVRATLPLQGRVNTVSTVSG